VSRKKLAAAEELDTNQLRLFSGHAHTAEVGLSKTHENEDDSNFTFLGQADALFQISKPRIGTQAIPARITVEPDQPMATPSVGLVEP